MGHLPGAGAGEAATVRLEDDAPKEPLVHADRLYAFGNACGQIGEHRQARSHLERAVALREQLLDADDPELIRALEKYGRVLRINGASEQAEPYIRRALEYARETQGEDAFLTTDLTCFLSGILSDRGQNEAAYRLALEAFRRHPPRLDPPEYVTIRVLDNYAQQCDRVGQADECRRAFHALIAVQAALSGVEHSALPERRFDLETGDAFAGHPDQAVDVILAVLAKLESDSGQKQRQRELSDCIKEANNFGHYYLGWGDPDKGRELFRG